jgi:hypothetical protein
MRREEHSHQSQVAAVSLIFPPLIESNFGSFFPSTAVLSAYLRANEIESTQEDLNEEFALFLLNEEILDGISSGSFAGITWDSTIAALARWARRNRAVFFDECGRHWIGTDRFSRENAYAYALEILARQFSIDPGHDWLDPGGPDQRITAVYERFYQHARIAERISAKTRLVGISVPMGPQLVPSLLLASQVKAAKPQVRVVLGGPTLSLMDTREIDSMLQRHTSVDAVVRFDGELPLLALSRQAIGGHWEPGAVPGVSGRQGTGVRHNDPVAGPDINSLPAPDYPRSKLDKLVGPALSVSQARGCYWGKCDYCDFVELYNGSPPFRGRRPDGFVAEIEQLVARTGIRRFHFITESIPPAFARKMSELILARQIDIEWISFAMVDRRFDRALLELMRRAGCRYLVIGLETTNTRVLKLVHKSADREENLRFLRDAGQVGLGLRVNLIPDLPSTTYAEALAALADISQLADAIETVNVFPFEATKSSHVGREPEKFGLVSAPSAARAGRGSGQAQYALNHLKSVDPAMTDEERAEIHRAYRKFAEQVNQRNRLMTATSPANEATAFRFAVEEMDMFRKNGKVVCTQVRRRARASIAASVVELLDPELSGQPFDPTPLYQAVGSPTGEALVKTLMQRGVLTPAGHRASRSK